MTADASRRCSLIAAKLREVGDRDLTRRSRAALRAAAQPLVPKLHEAARSKLPKSGGLNEQVAGQRISVSIPMGVRTASVRLRTTAPDTKQTDSGWVRHPTFGRREKGDWQYQRIPNAAGWWSDTLRMAGPAVTAALMTVMAEIDAEVRAL